METQSQMWEIKHSTVPSLLFVESCRTSIQTVLSIMTVYGLQPSRFPFQDFVFRAPLFHHYKCASVFPSLFIRFLILLFSATQIVLIWYAQTGICDASNIPLFFYYVVPLPPAPPPPPPNPCVPFSAHIVGSVRSHVILSTTLCKRINCVRRERQPSSSYSFQVRRGVEMDELGKSRHWPSFSISNALNSPEHQELDFFNLSTKSGKRSLRFFFLSNAHP